MASEYNTISGQVNQITSDMLTLIKGLTTIWTGEASETFITKALALENDMTMLRTMINTHEKELSDAANVFIGAEQNVSNRNAANATSVIS